MGDRDEEDKKPRVSHAESHMATGARKRRKYKHQTTGENEQHKAKSGKTRGKKNTKRVKNEEDKSMHKLKQEHA